MVEYSKYLEGLYKAVEGIGEKVFLKERPKAVNSKVNSFIVVDLPSYFSNREIDRSGSFNYYVTTAEIEVFVRDRVTPQRVEQLNVKKMDELLQKVQAIFPIKDEEHGIFVSNPRIIMSSSDGEGFHYSVIQARLTTYF